MTTRRTIAPRRALMLTGCMLLLAWMSACSKQEEPPKPPPAKSDDPDALPAEKPRQIKPKGEVVAMPGQLSLIAGDEGAAVVLQNRGQGDVQVAFEGDNWLQANGCGGKSLAAGGTCTVQIKSPRPGHGTLVAVLRNGDPASLVIPVDVAPAAKPMAVAPPPPPPDPGPDREALARQAMRQARSRAALPTGYQGGDAVSMVGAVGTPTELLDPQSLPPDPDDPYPRHYDGQTKRYDASGGVDTRRAILAYQPIRALLDSPIDSEICGEVRAHVPTAIYGTDGDTEVLPAQSALIGSCKAIGKEGVKRLVVTWHRIIRSTDKAQFLVQEIASDRMGRAGLVGDMNRRVPERLQAALLNAVIGGITMGSAILLDDSQTTSSVVNGIAQTSQVQSGRSKLAQVLGQQFNEELGGTVKSILNEIVDTTPTMTVAAGEPITIWPSTDLWLEEPEVRNGLGKARPVDLTVMGTQTATAAVQPKQNDQRKKLPDGSERRAATSDGAGDIIVPTAQSVRFSPGNDSASSAAPPPAEGGGRQPR